MITQSRLGILGAGHLAKSFISGLLKKNFSSKNIHVSNRNAMKLSQLKNEFSVHTYTDNCTAVTKSEFVIIGVKPLSVKDLCLEIRKVVSTCQPIIISLAASVTCSSIRNYLDNNDIPIIRAMCNTPIEFNQGFTALYSDNPLTFEQKKGIDSIFAKLGSYEWLENEHYLDPLTVAVGSAPAYALLFMRALQNAAESLNLPKELSKLAAVQVLKGAAALAESSSLTFDELQNAIATSGGVTEHSLKALDQKEFFSTFQKIYQTGMMRIEELKK